MKKKLLTLPFATIALVATPLTVLTSCNDNKKSQPKITIDDSEKQHCADDIELSATYKFKFSGQDGTVINLNLIGSSIPTIKIKSGFETVVTKNGEFSTVIMYTVKPWATIDTPFSITFNFKDGNEDITQTIDGLHIWSVKLINHDGNPGVFFQDIATFNFSWAGNSTTITPELVFLQPSGLSLETPSIQTKGSSFQVKVKRTDTSKSSFSFGIKFTYDIPVLNLTISETILGLTAITGETPTISFTGEKNQIGITQDLGEPYGWQSAAIYEGFTSTNIPDLENNLEVTVTEQQDGQGETHLGEIYPYVYKSASNDDKFTLALFFEKWNALAGTYNLNISIDVKQSSNSSPLFTDTFTMTFEPSIIEPPTDKRTFDCLGTVDEFEGRLPGFYLLHAEESLFDSPMQVYVNDAETGESFQELYPYSDPTQDLLYDEYESDIDAKAYLVLGMQNYDLRGDLNFVLTVAYNGQTLIDQSGGYCMKDRE